MTRKLGIIKRSILPRLSPCEIRFWEFFHWKASHFRFKLCDLYLFIILVFVYHGLYIIRIAPLDGKKLPMFSILVQLLSRNIFLTKCIPSITKVWNTMSSWYERSATVCLKKETEDSDLRLDVQPLLRLKTLLFVLKLFFNCS